MPPTPVTGDDWPQRGEPVTITFPNSKSDPVQSSVLEHVAQPRPHLLLAAPLVDGEVTVAAQGEAILMRWQSQKVMHSLAGTVDGFVATGVAAWRVSVGDVGEGEGTEAVEANEPVNEVESAEAVNQRRHVRVSTKRYVDVISAGKKLRVESIDISESGIRCRWRGDPFWVPSRASSVIVSLEIAPGRPITLTGSVVWVRRDGEGGEFSVAFTRLNESPKAIQLLRRYVVALERRQLQSN